MALIGDRLQLLAHRQRRQHFRRQRRSASPSLSLKRQRFISLTSRSYHELRRYPSNGESVKELRYGVTMVASEPSRKPIDPSTCSILAAVDALGDVWSILVLRELFLGVRRFNDIQGDLDISRSVLADRLGRLVDLGVVRTVPYQEPGERVRHEYRPTARASGCCRCSWR